MTVDKSSRNLHAEFDIKMSKFYLLVPLVIIINIWSVELKLSPIVEEDYKKFLELGQFAFCAYRYYCEYCRATLVLRDAEDFTSNIFFKRLTQTRNAFNMSMVVMNLEDDYQQSIRGELEGDVMEFVLIFWTEYHFHDLEDYLNEMICLPYWNSFSKIVIILSDNNNIPKFFISHTFQTFWKLKILRVFLCFWNTNQQKVQVYNFNPFTNNFAVDISNSTKEDFNNLLEFELLDLDGYPLDTFVFDAQQYTARLRQLDTLSENGKRLFVGLDGKLLEQVRDILNVTLNITRESETNLLTTYFMSRGNDSSLFPAQFLMQEKFDIWFNTLRAKPNMQVNYLFLHERDDLCMVVPRARPVPQYLSIFLLVPGNVWVITFFAGVLVSFTLGAIRMRENCKRKHFAFFDTYGILLSMPLPSCVLSGGMRERFVIGIWILFALMFCVGLQCTLTSTLVVPRFYPELNTMKDVVKAELRMYAVEYDMKLFRNNAKGIYTKRLAESVVPMKVITKDVMHRFQNFSGFIVRCEVARDFVQENDNDIFAKMHYHIAEQHPVPNAQAYPMPYGHPYYEEMVWIVHKLHESGLYYHWQLDNFGWYDDVKKKPKILVKNKNSKYDGFIQLSLGHLQSAFYLHSLGLTFATMSFFTELYFYHFVKTKKP